MSDEIDDDFRDDFDVDVDQEFDDSPWPNDAVIDYDEVDEEFPEDEFSDV